ncbi:hypothetical protein BH24ACT3_BH24ACT3_13390 [soil metagenome]
MDLTEHLRIIWQRRWRIFGLSLLVAAVIYARSTSLEEVYASDALLSVTTAQDTTADAQETVLFLAATYAELSGTRPVLAATVERAELSIDVDEADDRLDAAASGDVGFITITATGPVPAHAARLADAHADALIAAVAAGEVEQREQTLAPLTEEIAEVQEELSAAPDGSPQAAGIQTQLEVLISRLAEVQSQTGSQIEVIQRATEEDAPVAPTPRRDALLALIVALIVNAELAVAIEAFSGRFSLGDQGEAIPGATGLPVLASVPEGNPDAQREAFRSLRTNLLFMTSPAHLRTLAVVGSDRGVGKSHTAIGLATAAARLELPVALVDGDLRGPVIHQHFGLPVTPGLGDLGPLDDPGEVIRPVPDHPHLSVLSAGAPADDPAVILAGGLRRALAALTAAELVVVDTPPAQHFAEATAIAAQCDATIVVIDPATARRRDVLTMVENLRRVGATPIGVVLNRVAGRPFLTPYDYGREREPNNALRSS